MEISTRTTGKIGEDCACKWLENHGFLIVERNYLKKWGELDIIAAKDRIIHFIEVKSAVKQTSSAKMSHRPEENVHELKVKRLRRTIQTYLLERKYSKDALFQFHIVTVLLNKNARRARIHFLENIIL